MCVGTWLVLVGLDTGVPVLFGEAVVLREYMGEPLSIMLSLLASLSLLDGVSMSPVDTSVGDGGCGSVTCASSPVLCGDGVICSESCLAVLVAGVSPVAWVGFLACKLVLFLVVSCWFFICFCAELGGDCLALGLEC